MKSKFEFASLEDYREYLTAYYVGQMLARTANGVASSVVLDFARGVVDRVAPVLPGKEVER